jgi:DNA-binding MarR family transcriptional regulator
MPAAKTPTEHDNQNRKETDAKYPNASRSHEPILAAGPIFDKRLVNCTVSGTLMTMRRVVNAEWKPTVPALVNLVAASGVPHLRAAFAAAGLDGIRPAQAVALVPLAAGGLHASDLADQLKVSRQAIAQGVAALERYGYVNRVPDPADARARIIELTPRGRQALRVMRSNALDLEKRWQEILGQKRLGELRKILQTLLSPESPESAG